MRTHSQLRPVYQTIWGQANLLGWENCKEASVATLLGLDLRDVTPFNSYTQRGEYDAFQTQVNMQRWFAARGLTLIQMHGGFIPDCYYLAQGPCGPAPEGGDYLAHMVVMRAGQLAHDPIRAGRGLWRVDAIFIVVPQCISEARPHGWHAPDALVAALNLEPLDNASQPPWLRTQTLDTDPDASVWTQPDMDFGEADWEERESADPFDDPANVALEHYDNTVPF